MDKTNQILSLYFEAPLVSEILASGKKMSIKDEETMVNYEEKLKFFPIITSGTLKVMKRDENNNEILVYYLGAGESCAMAYVCCTQSLRSELRVVAEGEVELLAIPPDKLNDWLIHYQSWRSYIFNNFNIRFNELLRSLQSVAFHKLDERLVEYLRKKARITGKSSLQLSHSQIADELGTNRVVISRLLKQLENAGKLVLYRNEIKLLQAFGGGEIQPTAVH